MKSKNGLMYLLIAGEVVLLVLILVLGMINRAKGPRVPKDTMTAMENVENQIDPPAGETFSPVEDTFLPAEESGPSEESQESGEGGQEEPEEPSEEENTSLPEEGRRESFSEQVEAVLAQMTTEQKVAQIFMVSPDALTNTEGVTIAGSGTRTALENYPVGGLLYGSRNFMGVAQVREMITRAQAMSLEYSGQYLFAALTVEQEEKVFLAAAHIGQEEQLGALLDPQRAMDPAAVEGFIRLPLYQSLEQLAAEQEAGVKCFSVVPGGPGAVEALQNGADMLCVTEGFAEAYENVLTAVLTQEISEEALEEAVGHILTKKQSVLEQAAGNET